MNRAKFKQAVAAILLALTLAVGDAILDSQFGLDTVPATHACVVGGGSGGGC